MATDSSLSNATIVWHCDIRERYPNPRGIFFGHSPFSHMLPVLYLQISTTCVIAIFLHLLLSSLGQGSFIPYMLAGVLMGPSMLGSIESVKVTFFPTKTFYVNETLAFFGCTLFMFLVAVKMDPAIVLRTGKKTWGIGILCFAVPLFVSIIFALFFKMFVVLDPKLSGSLYYMAFYLSTSSFHVIACQLADLKLLNSELGRLATSSSMISGIVSWIAVTALTTVRESYLLGSLQRIPWMFITVILLVAFIFFVLRPIMLWMVRRTPEGEPIRQSYVHSVFLMLLLCAIIGELIGQHFMMGPIILGLAVPDGPPLGTALVEKLEPFVSSILMPLYFLYSGINFNFSLIKIGGFVVVEVIAFCAFCGKVVGTMLPTLYCKMSLFDSLSLGLIMSAQGITDIIYGQTACHLLLIDEESYSIMVLTTILLTGVSTPIVRFLYDPSKRYMSLNRRRNLEHANPTDEYRVIACLHSEESAPSLIHLLEMSNPTQHSPICLYLIHLIQLAGRSSPLLIDHRRPWKKSAHSNYSQRLINVFLSYERHMSGKVTVHPFTSISPYETMHDEICMLAAVKRISMIIMPFHQYLTLNGIFESSNSIRAVNRHVLRTAPCSVGILVERGILSRTNSSGNVTFYSVGVIFAGGADDREALAYAMRMAEHSNVRVTVIRLVEPRKSKGKIMGGIRGDQDGDVIHRFRTGCMHIKRHDYREEMIVDSVEMVSVIRSLEGCFDLILVGRRHESAMSSLFMGMTEWNENPELGVVGDMLVSSESTSDSSILVVQQQLLGGENEIPSIYICYEK